MRLIFWLFLLLNLSFFYWQYSQPKAPEAKLIEQEALPAGVDRLVLLRERGLGVQKKPSRSDGVMALDGLSGFAAVAGNESGHKSLPKQRSVDKQPKVVDASAEAARVKKAQGVAKPIVMACFTVGPFKNEAAAGQMYKALLPLGISVKQRLTERRIPKNYWVYLPPQKNYVTARRKVQALQKKGLDDMYIMGKGEMKNAVSLGLFKRKSTATERFNEVRKLDASTAMKTQYRTITKKWLDLKLDSAQAEKLARIMSLVDDLPDVKLVQQKSCK